MSVVRKDGMLELEILRHVEESPRLNNRMAALKLKCSIKLAHKVLSKMVGRGLLRVKKLHARRWDYFLTPAGLSEKARLTCEFLKFSMEFYHEARKLSSQVCRELAEAGLQRVAFVGTDDLAEIAYLGLKEWKLELCGIYDEKGQGQFLGYKVEPLSALRNCDASAFLVCLYDKENPMSGEYKLPSGLGVEDRLHWIFKSESSLKSQN